MLHVVKQDHGDAVDFLHPHDARLSIDWEGDIDAARTFGSRCALHGCLAIPSRRSERDGPEVHWVWNVPYQARAGQGWLGISQAGIVLCLAWLEVYR